MDGKLHALRARHGGGTIARNTARGLLRFEHTKHGILLCLYTRIRQNIAVLQVFSHIFWVQIGLGASFFVLLHP